MKSSAGLLAAAAALAPACLNAQAQGLPAGAALSSLGATPLSNLGSISPFTPADARNSAAAGGSQGLTVSTGATLGLTHSTNPRYAIGQDLGGDTVLQASPTLSLSGRSASFSGNLQYVANAYAFARATDSNDVRHSLRAQFGGDLIERHLDLSASAQHGQQALSAFGTPVSGALGGGVGDASGSGAVSNLFNPNVSDVTLLQISPRLRGRLAGVADAEVSWRRSHIDVQQSPTGAQDVEAWTGSLSGGSLLRWSLSALSQRQSFANGRDLESGLYTAQVSYPLTSDLTVRAGGGQEVRRFDTVVSGTAANRSTSVAQLGAAWVPSPRTSVSVDVFDRYFGTGWLVAISQRANLLSLRLGAGRTVVDGALGGGTATTGVSLLPAGSGGISVANLYNGLLSVQEPDAAKRQTLVGQVLANRGLDGEARVSGLSSPIGPSLQQRLEFGAVYALPRQTLSLLALRTRAEQVLKDPLNPAEDLARYGGVTQTVVTAGLGHRLTPDANLSFTLSRFHSQADRIAQPTTLVQAALTGSVKLGGGSVLGVGLRQGELRNPNLSAARFSDTSVQITFSTSF